MKILAVDTALGACSAAVLDGGTVLAHRFAAMERGHAEALAPMVEAVMAEAGLAFSALERLAVTTGPGTFTGQRVGLAFMRGLRLALGVPLAGVTTLAAMAAAARAETGSPWAASAADARRGEVYLEAATDAQTLIPVVLLPLDGAVARIAAMMARNGPPALAGTAGETVSAALRARGDASRVASVRQPDALWVARLACTMPVGDMPPRPLYLRAPDARPSHPRA